MLYNLFVVYPAYSQTNLGQHKLCSNNGVVPFGPPSLVTLYECPNSGLYCGSCGFLGAWKPSHKTS